MKILVRLTFMIMILTGLPLVLLLLSQRGLFGTDQIVVVMLVADFVLLSWVYASILKPLDALRKATRQIRDGELDFTLEADSDDEIGQLAQDFEEMRIRLKESREEKLLSEKASKELISNIAHDLKTPITTIRGYAEGILDGVASNPEKLEKYIRTIYNKSNDMASLIDELTFYSRIDTNRIPYNFKKLNVKGYFDDCAEEMGLDLEQKGFRFTYGNDVSDQTEVIADPEQLKKIINNIVGNSVKYMDKPEGRVSLSVHDQGDFIECCIADNGAGVAKKDQARIFDRFYRTDESRNSEKGGSGIGLSIVKKIIEDHGGRIWASGEEGEGLSIHFVLRKYFETA